MIIPIGEVRPGDVVRFEGRWKRRGVPCGDKLVVNCVRRSDGFLMMLYRHRGMTKDDPWVGNVYYKSVACQMVRVCNR